MRREDHGRAGNAASQAEASGRAERPRAFRPPVRPDDGDTARATRRPIESYGSQLELHSMMSASGRLPNDSALPLRRPGVRLDHDDGVHMAYPGLLFCENNVQL